MPRRVFFRSICLAALGAGIALPAAAQMNDPPAVTYPAALDRPSIVSWLTKETDVRPETVAAVTSEGVVAILQSRAHDGAIAVVVRGEILKPEVFARDGVLSWHATVQVDCAGKRIREGVTTGYAARNLLFDGKPVRPADADWSTPTASQPMDQVRRAVCEPGFRPPLTASDTAALVASAPPPPAPVKPPAPSKPAPQPKVTAAPPPPPARPTPPPASPAKPMAKVSAQIAAGGSDTEATRALERVKARFADRMAGLETRVVRAMVDGKTYHRAIILGFPDRATAAAFCVALQAGDQACFVRGDMG